MNWQTVGSIGELVGGLGVIVTLVYVARQMRANTIAMQQEAEREGFDGTRLVLSQIARDRDVARVLRTRTDERAARSAHRPATGSGSQREGTGFRKSFGGFWSRIWPPDRRTSRSAPPY